MTKKVKNNENINNNENIKQKYCESYDMYNVF